MTDHAKRSTLKRMGVLSASAVAAGLSAGMASKASASGSDASTAGAVPHFTVRTRISAHTNDIEIVLRNTGVTTARIGQLTPHETITRRGRFVLSSVLDDRGGLTLQPGQSVSIPMSAHPVALDASDVSDRAASLADTLRRALSVTLDDGRPATVSVLAGGPFA